MFKKFCVGFVPLLVLAIAVPVMAQEKAKGKRGEQKKPGAKARQQAQILPARLLEGLELTDEQKADLKEIAEEMKEPVLKSRKAMNDLLTDEQKEARKAAMAEAKKAGKKPQEAQKAVQAALKLTEEQQEKMAKLKAEQAELQKKMRDKIMAVLTPEQRKAVQEKMKKARGPRAKQGEGAKKPRGQGKGKAKKAE